MIWEVRFSSLSNPYAAIFAVDDVSASSVCAGNRQARLANGELSAKLKATALHLCAKLSSLTEYSWNFEHGLMSAYTACRTLSCFAAVSWP